MLHRSQVQAVPPRGHEAVPQGRALPHREVRDRAPRVPAGRARPRPHQAVRVPAAAAREAEGAPLLRRARAAVPHLLRQGQPRARASPARTCCACSRLRLDNVVYRLGFAALARPGTPVRAPRPLRRSTAAASTSPATRSRPTTSSRSREGSPAKAVVARRDRPHRVGLAVAAGRPRQPRGQGAARCPSGSRSTRPCRSS